MRKEITILYKEDNKKEKLIMKADIGDIPFTLGLLKRILGLKNNDTFKIIYEKEDKR